MESRAPATIRAIWSSLTIVLVIALLAGCSDKRSDAGGSTTTVKRTTTTITSTASTTSAAPGTSTAPSANDAVLAAYLSFWDLYIELGGTPPPFDAAAVSTRLDERTTGAEKAQLFDTTTGSCTSQKPPQQLHRSFDPSVSKSNSPPSDEPTRTLRATWAIVVSWPGPSPGQPSPRMVRRFHQHP
jgi:hypothetical protein